MSFDPTECEAISGGEYAARLLGADNPTRLVDHLIEHLSAKTGLGHESALLEFKATYHPSPEFPDDSDPDEFEWNVMKSFIALANAQGGCVLIGLEEGNGSHEIRRGDWDPDQKLSTYQEDGTRAPRDGQEEKDLVNHVRKIFFSDKASRNGKRFQFIERQSGRDPIPRDISIDGPSIARLSSLVEIYPCHSETYSCNVLAAVVRPINKGGELLLVQIAGKSETLYYRDSTAQNRPLTGHNQIKRFEGGREPESPDFTIQLHTPHTAKQAQATIFSNIPPPDPDFIGREGELARLHELCLSGKIPLIHAAGGTGKTQLAYKYAALHAQEYRGGCFYIPAEITTNWDEALHALIAPRVTTLGISTVECLGLRASPENGKDEQGKQQEPGQKETQTEKQKPSSPPLQLTSSDIVNAIVRRSREVGRVLFVMDNVETPTAFFTNEKLTRTFPPDFTNGISIITTARTSRGINSRMPSVASYPLGDLTQAEALSVLNGQAPYSSDEELHAAERIVSILGYRALYIRRVAQLANEQARHSYKRLLKKLLDDKLHVVQPQEDEDDIRAPEVIWEWTREHIARTPDGERDIQLAQTIALFPADGVADRILEALWYSCFGELGPQETLDAYQDDSDLFQDALKRLSEFSLIQYAPNEHIVRMHRLDRAAIQKSLKDTQSNWEGRIGSTLWACLCFSPSDWVELGNAHSSLLDYCPWESIGESNATQILSENPKYREHPAIHWDGFDDIALWQLLLKQPNFIDLPQCKPVFLSPLLAANSRLRARFNLSDFTGRWWAILLSNDPSLTVQCPWNRLKKNDWLLLLSHRPEMLCHCRHKEILNAKGNLEYRGDKGIHDYYIWDKTSYWGNLISAQPQFAQVCTWADLSPQDCISILKSAPQFATSCPGYTLKLLTGEEWADIIKTSPQVWNANVYPADTFPRKADYPMMYRSYDKDLFPNNLDYGLHWADVLKANPDSYSVCPFASLSAAEWCEILILNPQYSRENPPWAAIAELLTKRNLWCDHGFDLFNLPPLGERLDFPELAPFRPPKSIKDPILEAAPPPPDHKQNELIEKIRCRPVLSDICACDMAALEDFQRNNILAKQPQLTSIFPHCKTESIARSSVCAEEFQYLLTIPHGLDFSSEFVLEHEDASWTEKISAVEEAITHIANTPHSLPAPSSCDQSRAAGAIFAVAASIGVPIGADFPWDKLDGDMLCLILVNRPSLKDRCDFSKFSGRNWAVLLSENPEFEDICDWSKLDESDWTYLLNDRPWMVTRKPRT